MKPRALIPILMFAAVAAKFLNDEIARWAKVINTAGVKAE